MQSLSHRRWRAAFGLGLCLFIALAALWAVNLIRGSLYLSQSRQYSIVIHSGGLDVSVDHPEVVSPQGWLIARDRAVPQWIFFQHSPLWTPSYQASADGWTAFIPLWIFALLPAALSALAWRRTRKLTPVGHCPNCRYSREGLPPNTICPECGHAAG